jgi:nitronate monooxygenase
MQLVKPKIIQGGMGVGVSSWRLAKAVSKLGQLGVVSGTALDSVWVRRLQQGDLGENFRRAIKSFPVPEMAKRVFQKYYSSADQSPNKSFKRPSMLTAKPTTRLQELLIVTNFVEVFLAKEEHAGIVGINYLEKIQMATLPSLYGAMLAGVDYVLMGAGIPREIPGVLDQLSRHEKVELKLQVEGANSEDSYRATFFPFEVMKKQFPPLIRPQFLAIVSSSALALTLAKKATGKVNGFIIEGASAGGHNAPPRGSVQLNERGEPIYGPKDNPNLQAIKELGLPFWLAGSFASHESLCRALEIGASGVQIGTAFALCEESGLSKDLKKYLLENVKEKKVNVFTDPAASPTGFPFKVASIPGTLSAQEIYNQRPRKCDVGYLRRPYKKENGKIGYRCPAEPVVEYVAKGGTVKDTENRKCLCNALLANIDLGQHQKNGYEEKALVTIGDNVNSVDQFMQSKKTSYTAEDIVLALLG